METQLMALNLQSRITTVSLPILDSAVSQ
jgi:hypothetical protein